MTTVIGDISISLDGYVTAPGADLEHGLGVDGEAVHDWAIDPTDIDREVLATTTRATGAVVMGRNLFDIVDGPHGWNDEMGYGASEVGTPPFFVVTSSEPREVRLPLDFSFVLDGPEAAVTQARAAVGDRDVVVMGGGQVVRSCLDAGLLDELRLHLSPVVFGGGTPLFDGNRPRQLVQRDVVASPKATHLTYVVG